MSESFYNILGVPETASKDEIKKAYRSLSLKLHPDRNPNNLEAVGKFQKINEAYETLSDEQKREEYDMMNKNPFLRMASHGGGGMDTPFQDMDDIFSALFGNVLGAMPGMSGRQQGMPPGMPPGMHFAAGPGMNFGGPGGPKIHVFRGGPPMGFTQALQKPTPIIQTVAITMEQVLLGATIPVDIERWMIENGNKVFERETIYVTVPKGVDDNEIIILREKGNILNDEIKGDLKIFIKVENTTQFERKGLDLIIKKPISLKDALCGFSFELKYINGKVYTLNNNSGSIIPSGYIKTIPNMGLTREGHTGNLLIHFQVDFPEKLTEEQIKSIKEIL
jgi:DnaJ-class molecular chaperone